VNVVEQMKEPTMKWKAMVQWSRRQSLQRALMALAAVTGLLWPYMFSIANTGTTFTLTNRTRYYLHANVNNETFVYIVPGGSVIVDVAAPTTVFASVRYSPGQEIKGVGERIVDIAESVTNSEGASTCSSDSQGGSTCSSTGPSTTSSASPGRWDVLPTDLSTE
jgi:hypothetical protein